MKEPNTAKMKFGLLGEHLGHSYSPQIHQELHEVPYALYEAAPENVERFLQETDLDGINVTIPYKQTVMPLCIGLSDTARRIGAVNTLKRTPEGWVGYNTDYYGFCAMLRDAGIDPAGRKALVLGSGGASLTAQTALRDLGASQVTVISRKGDNTYADLDRHKDAGIIVNTTPVGMYPGNGEALLDPGAFPCCEGVADVIYNPARTELLLRAERSGIPYAGGLHMLAAQAKKSAEIWLDREIPGTEILRIRRKLEASMQNIVLIGMPGSGKTSIGQELARRTGREFLDADRELVQRAGRTIPEIFAEGGEEAFRRLETEVLRDLGKRSGCVIATGGGCITREDNYPLLHQNSRIFWIRRDLKLLPAEGRPLSMLHGAEELYEARKASYERFADEIVENSTTVEEAVREILHFQEYIII